MIICVEADELKRMKLKVTLEKDRGFASNRTN